MSSGRYRIKPWVDSDETQIIRTYRAWPDAPTIPFLHIFGAPNMEDANWREDPADNEAGVYRWGLGMVRNQSPWWFNFDGHFCGSMKGWREGFTVADDPPLEWTPYGWSTCCAPVPDDWIPTDWSYIAHANKNPHNGFAPGPKFGLKVTAPYGTGYRPYLAFGAYSYATAGVGVTGRGAFGFGLPGTAGIGATSACGIGVRVGAYAGVGVALPAAFGVRAKSEIGVGVRGESEIGVAMPGTAGVGVRALAAFGVTCEATVESSAAPPLLAFGVACRAVAGVGTRGEGVAFGAGADAPVGVGATGTGMAFGVRAPWRTGVGGAYPSRFGFWGYGFWGVGWIGWCRFAFDCPDWWGVGIMADDLEFALSCEALVDFDDSPPAPTPDYTGCSACPLGTFHEWTVTVAGGTGAFAAMNGDWPASVAGPCNWSVSVGTVTVVLGLDAMLTGFQVQITAPGAFALWKPAGGVWHCAADNSLALDSSSGTGSCPGTVTASGTG